MVMNSAGCCGVKEYCGLRQSSNPQGVLEQIGYHLFIDGHHRSAFVYFTDKMIQGQSLGYAVQKYIEDHKLGPILATRKTKNTNSGNDIVMWIWEYDHDKFRKWYELPHIREIGYTRGAITRWKLGKAIKRNLPTLTRFFTP